ncbi:Hypothetical_protein [Hexamita inflata]|uniref:Hypothetical_protein n=1 Tax=Hexamita inflata TaxID=28002 RepID=A0AA86R8V5_9EUKA|nr:Hypothetical protein HINF_LOCUS47045 [Hexamita inflata]CAI9969516.1 Hypothetical protein HINF_LOCUS57161 [Hexamita inflata]
MTIDIKLDKYQTFAMSRIQAKYQGLPQNNAVKYITGGYSPKYQQLCIQQVFVNRTQITPNITVPRTTVQSPTYSTTSQRSHIKSRMHVHTESLIDLNSMHLEPVGSLKCKTVNQKYRILRK